MTCSHSPTYTVTSPHTSHPFTQYDASHSVTCPPRLSHPVAAGDSHTKKLLRQSHAHTHHHSHGRTLSRTHSHPCTVNLRHTNRLAVTQPHAVTPSLRAAPALTLVTNSRVGALTSRRRRALIGGSLIGRHCPAGPGIPSWQWPIEACPLPGTVSGRPSRLGLQ